MNKDEKDVYTRLKLNLVRNGEIDQFYHERRI